MLSKGVVKETAGPNHVLALSMAAEGALLCNQGSTAEFGARLGFQ